MNNETKFLVESIRTFLGSSDGTTLPQIFKSVNIKKLKQLVFNHDIGGLFYNMYIDNIFGKCLFGQDIIDFLKNISGRNALINSVHQNEIIRLAELFEKNNIDYFYMKGFSTRIRCNVNDYVNSSNDFDFLIKNKDYENAKMLLIKDGYKIPYEHYKKISNSIPFHEYEKNEGEISFIKKENNFQYIVDLQWDLINHDRTSFFHKLYDMEKFYNFEKKDFITLGTKKINVFPIELELINMSFHYAFHHGFNGIKWLVGICLFLRNYESEIDFDYILQNADYNLKKILGIILMLAYDYNYKKELSIKQKKVFCVDRLLPFEYPFYRNITTGLLNSKEIGKIMRIVKIILPYKKKDSIKIFRLKIKPFNKNIFAN